VTDIELSPRVADPFVRMNWRDEGNDPAGFRAALMRDYEQGKVIILENAPFRIDFDLLNKVSLPRGRRFQKLSDKILCTPRLYRAEVRRLLYEAFGTDILLYLAFRREVMRVGASARFRARCFPALPLSQARGELAVHHDRSRGSACRLLPQ
jgi:hypothetical protein